MPRVIGDFLASLIVRRCVVGLHKRRKANRLPAVSAPQWLSILAHHFYVRWDGGLKTTYDSLLEQVRIAAAHTFTMLRECWKPFRPSPLESIQMVLII